MARKELPDLKGYELDDLPDPEHTPISAEAKAIVIALLACASEMRLARMAAEPAAEINAMNLKALKAQMAGGIIPGVIVPGKGH
jgi:hypothetical protein